MHDDDLKRWREPISTLPSPETVRARQDDGWELSAIEWVKTEGGGERADAAVETRRPIPYGLRVAADCAGLEIDPVEMAAMRTVIAMIASDHPLSRVAEELNSKGFRPRRGAAWSQLSVFKLLPRVIEVGPEILSEADWTDSKRRLLSLVS